MIKSNIFKDQKSISHYFFNRLGGTNNPIQSTSIDNPDATLLNNIGTAPYHMSHTFGGQHADLTGSGPGR